jgi:hypothetical protein
MIFISLCCLKTLFLKSNFRFIEIFQMVVHGIPTNSTLNLPY